MARQKVVLSFEVDTTEEGAWEIAEGLESAAIKRGYFTVSSYVEQERGRALGTEAEPITSSAEVRQMIPGNAPDVFGGPDGVEPITLGGDGGRFG